MSTRWYGTIARSAADGLAVPMSMPRYTAMESTETSSASGRRRARARANVDFPDAVGPTRATGDGRGTRPYRTETGMRVRVDGGAVTSTRFPRRWCGAAAVTSTRA